MKLKKYLRKTYESSRRSAVMPMLSLSGSQISFNQLACELFNIKEGDPVLLHEIEDEAAPNNWVIELTKDEQSFAINKKSSQLQKSLSINCKEFCIEHQRGHYVIEKILNDGVDLLKPSLQKETRPFTRNKKAPEA